MAAQYSWTQVGSTDADIERVYRFLLERGSPAPSSDLALHLIDLHWREQERRHAQAAERDSRAYQPRQTYAVDERVHFDAMGNREGVVKKLREGDNPRLGAFRVMTVKFDEDSKPREFAMAYERAHPLNEDRAAGLGQGGDSQDEVRTRYGEDVRARIVARIGADKEFVRAGDNWYLSELIPQINPGYLNIAEAAIEQSGNAVRTTELVKVLEMTDTKGAAALFAVNSALSEDPRFDAVGPVGDARWYLTRLEPLEAIEYPSYLRAPPARVSPLVPELEAIVGELHDEADLNGDSSTSHDGDSAAPEDSELDSVTIILTYPHRRAGTLPLTPAVRALLPEFSNPRLIFSLKEASSERKGAAFAVREGNYIAGLGEWFNEWDLSPGATIMLRRGSDPLSLTIDPQLSRERALWVRVARAEQGRLSFTTERRPLAHKYDEEMLIVSGDPLGIEKLSDSAQAKLPLGSLLEEIFPELAKLNIAGTVHPKTLYSAVNFVRRVGPRAVMTALIEGEAFAVTAGGNFVLNEARR